MSEITRIACVTGHRPPKLGQAWDTDNYMGQLLLVSMEHLFAGFDVEGLITGGALGIDQAAAEAAYEMGLPYSVAVPFEGQEAKWNVKAQKRYRRILDRAHKVIVLHDHYDPKYFQLRNQYMVDHAGLVLAWYDGSPGGTRNCVEYALEQGVPVWNDPAMGWIGDARPWDEGRRER